MPGLHNPQDSIPQEANHSSELKLKLPIFGESRLRTVLKVHHRNSYLYNV